MGLTKILLAIVIGFIGGTFFGFYQGPIEYLYKNSPNEAALQISEIHLLKSGKIDDVIDLKETFINSELEFHGRYLESRLSWLLPHKVIYDNNSHIKRAVKYRLANPYIEPKFTSQDSVDEELISEMNMGLEVRLRLINKVIQTYKDE